MDILPAEIKLNILLKLDYKSLLNMCNTNVHYKELYINNKDYIYKNLIKKELDKSNLNYEDLYKLLVEKNYIIIFSDGYDYDGNKKFYSEQELRNHLISIIEDDLDLEAVRLPISKYVKPAPIIDLYSLDTDILISKSIGLGDIYEIIKCKLNEDF